MTDCDTLPSAESGAQLARGEMRALPLVLIHTLGRAALIGTGLAVVGQKDNLVRNALAGAVAIEVFVVGYQYLKNK